MLRCTRLRLGSSDDRSLQDSFTPFSDNTRREPYFIFYFSAADLPRNFSILVSISQVNY